MRGWAWKVAGPALAVSLLLPWFYGTDDGDPLTIAGWDTEPRFTQEDVASPGSPSGTRRARNFSSLERRCVGGDSAKTGACASTCQPTPGAQSAGADEQVGTAREPSG